MQLVGHEANGFGRRYLHEWEARALYEARYMAPPDFWCPGTWQLSAGGIPIPPVPHDVVRKAAIHRYYYEVLTPKERNDPLWGWGSRQRRPLDGVLHGAPEHGAGALRGHQPSIGKQERRRAEGMVGRPRRTLAWVLDHIAAGNHPRLTMSQRHWMPRKMDGSSSSSRSSSSAPGLRAPAASPLGRRQRHPAPDSSARRSWDHPTRLAPG
jgi:hypothetical protein